MTDETTTATEAVEPTPIEPKTDFGRWEFRDVVFRVLNEQSPIESAIFARVMRVLDDPADGRKVTITFQNGRDREMDVLAATGEAWQRLTVETMPWNHMSGAVWGLLEATSIDARAIERHAHTIEQQRVMVADGRAELREFKAKVRQTAMELAARHDWCGVVSEALDDMGIPVYLEHTVNVRMTVKVRTNWGESVSESDINDAITEDSDNWDIDRWDVAESEWQADE